MYDLDFGLHKTVDAWGCGGDGDNRAKKCGGWGGWETKWWDGERTGTGHAGRKGEGQDLRDGVEMGMISIPVQVSNQQCQAQTPLLRFAADLLWICCDLLRTC